MSASRDPSEAPPSSSRRPRTERRPLRVDEVGAAAVAIAAKAVHRSVPKLLETRAELRNAPLDHRDAFVISLIDGTMDVLAIVDVSGMPASKVLPILARLAELGIVSL